MFNVKDKIGDVLNNLNPVNMFKNIFNRDKTNEGSKNQWWDFLDLFPNKTDDPDVEINIDESTVTGSGEKENKVNINQQEGDKDLSQSISVTPNNIAFSPLESGSGTTQIIDLRTAQDVSGQSGADIGGSSTVVDSEIADLDPERRFSPYESLVRSV